MRITNTDMMASLQNLQQVMNGNLSTSDTDDDSSIKITDGVSSDISEMGRRIGGMMDRMGRMDQSKMEEQMTEMTSAIDDLGLADMDLDSMTDDEIAAVAVDIDAVMESFRPEDIESGVSIESMSTSDLKDYVSAFQSNTEEVLQSVGKMQGMMEGKPPMGGGGGKPQGGVQGAISSYQSQSSTSTDEDLSMIESFLEALETDEEDDSYSDLSEFYKLIGEYLTV